MRRYAVLEVDLLRGKIIRRNVCTAVALHTRRSCPTSTALIMNCILKRIIVRSYPGHKRIRLRK